MTFATPEISVIISTYDDCDHVAKKLAEVKGQSAFLRAEFIFIESASPGNERELLEPFCAEHANCKLISLDERVNLYRAWNLGWQAATASLICISNMDDAMHPQLLERVLAKAVEQPCDLYTVLILKQTLGAGLNSFEPDRLCSLELSSRPGPFFAWRRDLIDSFGQFDDRFEVFGDKDFWARASAHKLQIGLIEEALYLYTKHSDQLSKSSEFEARQQADRILLESTSYPHEWPKSLTQRLKRIQKLRRLPVVGKVLTARQYLEWSD